MLLFFFFFFSSRRRHTRLQGDWSSDVCSSDLPNVFYRHRLPRNLWSHGEATWRKRTPGINDPARGHRRALSRRRVLPTKPWLGSRLLVPCLPPCASRDGCGRLVSSPTPRLARHPWSYSLFSYQGKTGSERESDETATFTQLSSPAELRGTDVGHRHPLGHG